MARIVCNSAVVTYLRLTTLCRTFSGKPGDECGLLHWIGTNYGTYVNPRLFTTSSLYVFPERNGRTRICTYQTSSHSCALMFNMNRAKKVLVRCSSPPSRYTQPALLVDRRFVTTSFTSGNPAWYILDLLDHSLICNYYTLRADGSDCFLRSWNLQVGPPELFQLQL